jgi:type IV pilus assembly protein PilQ
MKLLPLKLLSILECSALLAPSAFSAMGAMDSPGAVTDAAPDTSNDSQLHASDIISTNKPMSGIMGGIELPKSLISMDFQDADVRDVFRLLAIKSGINVIYGADVTGTISIHLDQVPFDQAFQTVLTLKGLVALTMGAKVVRVVSSTALTTEQTQAATFTRVFHLNYALAEDMKKPLDAIRTAASRKGVSTVDTKTNSLIVTDTQEGLKEVEDLIPVLDKKPAQVDIETKIVEVNLDNKLDTGISWNYATDGKFKVGATQDASGPTAGLGGTAIGAPQIQTVSPGQATGISGTGVNLNTITQTGFSFLTRQGTYLLSAQIAALASQSKVKILSTPHIVTTNNEEATINVADQIPYDVSTLSNGVSQTSVQFISAGVKLVVKPTVNADRRITLKVKPEVSTPGAASSDPHFPPTVNTRNAETTVVLRDGETIAIGGLISENITKTVSGVPLLMSIPVIGYLFKTTSNEKQRTELIIFLTPRIAGE